MYLHISLELCSQLGFPVATEKVEGPSTVLTFLGIEIDSVKQEVRLPADKLSRLKALNRGYPKNLPSSGSFSLYWATSTMQPQL